MEVIDAQGVAKMPDHPLVTFAIFAYNQEKYIREALEAAFSQTYEPLEIILSDDCSSDRTFEIMQEMAAAYEGPHRIVLRQSEINFGTALHVSAVAKRAKGELIIVAAGDDISVPTRTARLTQAWIDAGKPVAVVHSNIISFLDSDCTNSKVLKPIILEKYGIKEDMKVKGQLFMPPSCAYSRELFEAFPPLIGGSIIEDGPMFFRAVLIGKIIYIDEELVFQRRLDESSGTGYNINNLSRWNFYILSRVIAAFTAMRDLHIYKEKYDPNLGQLAVSENLLKHIRNVSKCLFIPDSKKSIFFNIKVAIHLMLHYKMSANIYVKIYFVLAFLGKREAGFVVYCRRVARLLRGGGADSGSG